MALDLRPGLIVGDEGGELPLELTGGMLRTRRVHPVDCAGAAHASEATAARKPSSALLLATKSSVRESTDPAFEPSLLRVATTWSWSHLLEAAWPSARFSSSAKYESAAVHMLASSCFTRDLQ